MVVLGEVVDADGDGQHQGVVLAGDDGHAVGVADPEPALGDVGHRDAVPGDLVSRARSSRFLSLSSSLPWASLMTTVSRTRSTLSSTRKIRSPRSFSIQKSSPRVSSFSRSRYRVPAGAPSGVSSDRPRRLNIDPLRGWPPPSHRAAAGTSPAWG